MQYLCSFFTIFLSTAMAYSAIIINEVSFNTNSDWIELKATNPSDNFDIAALFVTMYYGTNESIAQSATSLKGTDDPQTPFDDRFAVIHFTSENLQDETDLAGDLNKNGIRDLYCNNYGLWSTDCVVAIDTDDDPANNGIIDFMAFSNRDGSPNSTIKSYLDYAILYNQWINYTGNPQECMIWTGDYSSMSYPSLSRINSNDTNSPSDFILTPYSTPGRENIVNLKVSANKLISPVKNKITTILTNNNQNITFPLFVYRDCSIKIRIFNSAGSAIFSSTIITNAAPGYFNPSINTSMLRGKLLTGLYLVKVEAISEKNSDNATIYLIMVQR